MSRQLTAEDARQSLGSHVADKGLALNEKYGPEITWSQLMLILEDRTIVRYPCEIVFDAEHLLEGEFAHPMQKGEHPEEGFILYVHPFFAVQPHRVPALVLYQLVAVNYGAFASPDDAETFGSCALGIPKEEYYELLCEAADELIP
jgi:hypothetical protein